MVEFIRNLYGDYFTLAVAGYPIPHPESLDRQHDLQCLKRKVDAGADFVISQIFYKAEDFIEFVHNCRKIGIRVPIIPGILAINSYRHLIRSSELSGVPLPEQMIQDLLPIQENNEMVRNYGIDYTVQLCRTILESGVCNGLHFYTFNQQEPTVQILKTLGLWNKQCISNLSWRTPTNHHRFNETVRPLFWIHRPDHYVWLTQDTKLISSNRFLIQTLPSIDEYLTNESTQITELDDVQDLSKLFVKFYSQFCDGSTNSDGKWFKMPWFQVLNLSSLSEYKLALVLFNFEFDSIVGSIHAKYIQYIREGILITNSFENGHFGQSSSFQCIVPYLEFFLQKCHLEKLRDILRQNRCDSLRYALSDPSGTIVMTNWTPGHQIQIMNGLLPGKGPID